MNKKNVRLGAALGLVVLFACSSDGDATSDGDLSTGGQVATSGDASGGQGATGGLMSGGQAASGGQASSGGLMSGGQGATGGDASGGQGATGGDASGGQGATGGDASGGQGATGGTGTPINEVRLPPGDQGFDYQIGGGYPLPDGVGIVSRDRKDAPAPGAYNICYVNGFQTQPDEDSVWAQHPDLILRDKVTDKPVIDEDWGEALLDVSTPDKRRRLADLIGGWIEQCASDGFDAVEVDNLDSYDRSGMRLTRADSVAYMALLSTKAHAVGLAMGQKNATDLVQERAAMGTDFVVSEECDCWDECDVYTAAYEHVLVVEYATDECASGQPYSEQRFVSSCAKYEGVLQRVFRDVDVRPRPASYPSAPGGYRYRACD